MRLGNAARAMVVGTALICATSPVLLSQVQPEVATVETKPEVQPAAINVEFDGTSAEEAFKVLGEQAGVKFTADDPKTWFDADPVFLKVEGGRFWPTYFELCKQSQISGNIGFGVESPNVIKMFPKGRAYDQFAGYDWVEVNGFILAPQSLHRSYSAQLNKNVKTPRSSTMALQMLMLADPSVKMLSLMQPVVTKAVDENGLSLGPKQDPNRYGGYGMNSSFLQNLSVGLVVNEKAGQTLVELEGYIPIRAITKSERVEIDNPLTANPVQKDFPRTTVDIGPLKDKGGGSYELPLTFASKIPAPARNRGDTSQVYWSAASRIRLLDQDGDALSYSGGGTTSSSGGRFVMNVTFRATRSAAQPAKLLWDAPIEIDDVQIPFSFKNLPLP